MLHTFMTSYLHKLIRVCLAVISLTAFSHRIFKQNNIIQPSGHLTINMILMQLNVYNGGLQSAYLVFTIIPIINALVSLIFLVLSNVVCVLT